MAELLAPRFSQQQFAVLVHRHGAALFFGKKETEMKTDKTSSRAEDLLAELVLSDECELVSVWQ